MSAIYFVRHAQAGARHNYDVLSDLGRGQVAKLADYFKKEGINAAAVISGRPLRQRETAEALGGATIIDSAWDEFDLSALYTSIASRLLVDHDGFSADHDEMHRDLAADPHKTSRAVARCDQTVIRAWITDRYSDASCQRWADFKEGVLDGIERLRQYGSGERVVIFTSAGPIGTAVGYALGCNDEQVLPLMAVMYNTGITTIRLGESDTTLFTFNALPHLEERSLRSFR